MRETQLVPIAISTGCWKRRPPIIIILFSIKNSSIWLILVSEITMSSDNPFVVFKLFFRSPVIAGLYMTRDVSYVQSGSVDLISSKLILYNKCFFVAVDLVCNRCSIDRRDCRNSLIFRISDCSHFLWRLLLS